MTEIASISRKDDRLIVTGVLNFTTVVNLWKESLPLLANSSITAFNIDLSAVTSANSAGLALLLEWLKLAKQVNKPIQFYHLPPQLLSIAVISGIENLFS